MENSSPNLRPFISGHLARFEGDLAIIKLDDGQELNWPKDKLPQDYKKGSVIKLYLSTNQNEDEERTKMAKTLLNEIFRTSQ
ncbi:DUF3006 domain-containing protein [Candidatus Uhrbacteria bacterium]|nr:DUF3006 domain-containing protein [Candidatus Uhrbacteria bacterium]